VSAVRLTNFTDITALHEIYEDLGVHKNSMLDSSFNVNNFECETLDQSHPDCSLAFECTLSGTTNVSAIARQLSPGHQTPQSVPALTGSAAVSSTSILPPSIEPDVYEPISELFCLSPSGPCFGENGEAGFSTQYDTGPWSKKERYWLNEDNAASFAAQCTAIGKSVSERANVGLRSSFPINEGSCPAGNGPFMPPNAGDLIEEDFQFPSWDELPVEFQDPATSADYDNTVPTNTTEVDVLDLLAIDSSASAVMPWDNEDMNFSMDMDLDMDLDLSMDGLGKC
jgi:hypothetical protein